MPNRKQPWALGDVFTIPLDDGSFCVGQVVGYEAEALNSLVAAFFRQRIETISDEISPDPTTLVSLQFVTRASLDQGIWTVICRKAITEYGQTKLIANAKRERFIGTKIIGCGIINKLMKALHGLHPWDGFHNPDYLDNLLINQSVKPPVHDLLFQD